MVGKKFSLAEADKLITTSFREETLAALQMGVMSANPKHSSKAYHQTKRVLFLFAAKGKETSLTQRFLSAASQEAETAQLKSQLEKLLQVKELIQKFA